MACLRWTAEGYGNEVTSYDVLQAWSLALETADQLERLPETKTAVLRFSEGESGPAVWLRRVLGERIQP